MSEYTSYSYSYRPAVAMGELAGTVATATLAGAGIALAAAGVAKLVSAAVLFAAVRDKAGDLEAKRLKAPDAWLGAIRSEPLVAAVMSQVMPELPHLLEGKDARALDDSLPKIETAFMDAREQLLSAEAGLLYRHLTGALSEMGYAIRQSRRPLPDCIMIHGSKADGTAMAIRLTPKASRVEIDLSGFSGNACEQETARLHEHLQRRGVMLARQVTQRHGRKGGGALTARVQTEVNDDQKTPARPARREKERN